MKRMKNLVKGTALLVVMFLSAQFANAQQKIGHVSFNEIFSLTSDFKAAETQLKTLGETKTKELQSLYTEFQNKQNSANEKLRNRSEANKDATDAELQTLGSELQDMQTRITDIQRIAEEDMQKKQEELFAPIHKKVADAINAVSKEKGYAYVFDISTGSIPYFQGGDDLTPAVKTKLGIQ